NHLVDEPGSGASLTTSGVPNAPRGSLGRKNVLPVNKLREMRDASREPAMPGPPEIDVYTVGFVTCACALVVARVRTTLRWRKPDSNHRSHVTRPSSRVGSCRLC